MAQHPVVQMQAMGEGVVVDTTVAEEDAMLEVVGDQATTNQAPLTRHQLLLLLDSKQVMGMARFPLAMLQPAVQSQYPTVLSQHQAHKILLRSQQAWTAWAMTWKVIPGTQLQQHVPRGVRVFLAALGLLWISVLQRIPAGLRMLLYPEALTQI